MPCGVACVYLCKVPWLASKGDGVQVWVVMFIAAEVEDAHWARAGEHILLLLEFKVQVFLDWYVTSC